MKKERLCFLFGLLAAIVFVSGCPMNGLHAGQAGPQRGDSKTLFTEGRYFQANGNPLISFSSSGHYSSDPAVEVIQDGESGNDTLMLITSTDLVGVGDPKKDWPMDGIHMYASQSDNLGSGDWYEYGKSNGSVPVDPVIAQKDFWGGASVPNDKKHLFAPDLQYVKGANKLYMYVPYTDPNGNWQIGIASSEIGNGQLFGGFSVEASPFRFTNGKGGSDNFLIDPGVFYNELGDNYFMAYVDTSRDHVNTNTGNISIAKLSDMKTGTRLGNISFQKPFDNYYKLKHYMEGPDICMMKSPSGQKKLYLVFSADSDNNTDCAMIGYATADPVEFAFSPTGCWKFKGWIFKGWNIGNNHADLVQYKDKYYIFYQQGPYKSNTRGRQACCQEIKLADNGDILGVSVPSDPSQINNLSQYTFLHPDSRNTPNYLSNQWINWGNNGVGTYLTLTGTDENFGINDQTLNIGWIQQEWYLENVPAMTINGKLYVFPNNDAVRIKNLWTASNNYYMTCNDVNKTSSSSNPVYGILNQGGRNDWSTQVWIKEPVDGAPGYYRLRSFWTPDTSLSTKPARYPLYLTLTQPTGTADVYAQPLGHNENQTEWASQHWRIE